jgi:cellulose synthase/poly-beta-1,6-N-acetylglucosamine synthase-like glycosyltransferase/DNA-binding NarL/FixJ family response regulator
MNLRDSVGTPLAIRYSVLCIDDEESVRKLVATALQRSGYDVITANNGQDALERLREAIPDLIISDVSMPTMDGLSFLRQLRSDADLKEIPFILLTALDNTENIEEGLNLGADDYLTKPFEMRELLARVRIKLARPSVSRAQLVHDQRTGFLNESNFIGLVTRELVRTSNQTTTNFLAYIYIDELPSIVAQLGARAGDEIAHQLSIMISARPHLDSISHDNEGYFGLLMLDTTNRVVQQRMRQLTREIVNSTFFVAGTTVRLTPIIGYSYFEGCHSFDDLEARAMTALNGAAAQLDLRPMGYTANMDAQVVEKRQRLATQRATSKRTWIFDRIRLFIQIALTLIITLIIPFGVYWGFDQIGYDITGIAYILFTIGFVITALMIWIEGIASFFRKDPPIQTNYPPASAIIAAYMPNEAATIIETIEAFLKLQYPSSLQIILAYNTPRDLPIEQELRELAAKEPKLVLLRVEHSTSKAQNVNAALSIATGEIIGVFDADHQPMPTSFMRAWHWIASGYDIVQGHCVIRNGTGSWVAKLIAVEFETIYAVSHPGRARVHGFGIFGGTNGYWRADLLRQTRMHGFMLTEDIDSSMRVIAQGYKVASDPNLISYELGPVTLTALWNQRMRWAQGWLQVSVKHLLRSLRSSNLTARQKLGFLYLLGWREVFPWISPQIFPLIAYWIWRGDTLDWAIPIYVLTTLFTLSVVPSQVLFAYLRSVPEHREHPSWFVWYLLIGSFFYSEWKNLIARVAVVKEFMQERTWRVTPRIYTNTRDVPHE